MCVSILVITYNQENYILETLKGIVNQTTNFPIEIIISNDCSPDNTNKIIEDFIAENKTNKDIIFKYFNHKTNLGAINNFYFAIKQATGKYIAICEGDDYWIDNTKLQKQVDFLENNQEYNLVYTDAKYFTQETNEFDLQRTQQIDSFDDLLVKNRIFTLTICLRKDVLDMYMSEDYMYLKHLPLGDYPLWLFASTKGKAKYMPIVSAVYRILNESASHSKNLSKVVKFEEAVNECRLYFLDKYYAGDKEKLKKKLLGSKALSIIRMALQNKNEEIFNQYKGELKYIADYKYKYYLIYSLAKVNFKLFTKTYYGAK